MKKILALDIGGTTVKSAIFDAEGTLLVQWFFDTDLSGDGTKVFDDIIREMKDKSLDPGSLLGIGIGVPGTGLNNVIYAVNLGWKDMPVEKELRKRLESDVPIFVENDANIAALGEFGQMDATIRHMALVTLGTGIGGGIIIDGKIVRGSKGSGGEIGHLKMTEDGLACNCGLSGCLETIASATGLVRHTLKRIEAGEKSDVDTKNLTAKDVMEAAEAGDPVALSVVNEAAYQLARAFAHLNALVDLEEILLGGGVAKAGAFFFEKIRTYYRDVAFTPVKMTTIKGAKLGNDAGIYGAMEVVRRNV